MNFTLLVIDDEKNIREGLATDFEMDGYNVKVAANGQEGIDFLEKGNIDLVIDWTEDARDFYSNNKTSNLLAAKYCFREGITYTDISSRGTGFRYLPHDAKR